VKPVLLGFFDETMDSCPLATIRRDAQLGTRAVRLRQAAVRRQSGSSRIRHATRSSNPECVAVWIMADLLQQRRGRIGMPEPPRQFFQPTEGEAVKAVKAVI
jgi:hypothetical protein